MRINIGRVKEITNDWIKSLIYGNVDVRTGEQYLPHGIDSKPVKGKISLYVQTADSTEAAHIGYLSESDKTQPGETRLYATKDDGTEVFSVLFKFDGSKGICEFNGTDDNFVRYSKLKEEYDKTVNYLTTLKAETRKLAVILDGIVPGTSVIFDAGFIGKSTGDISSSKISAIKCSKTD